MRDDFRTFLRREAIRTQEVRLGRWRTCWPAKPTNRRNGPTHLRRLLQTGEHAMRDPDYQCQRSCLVVRKKGVLQFESESESWGSCSSSGRYSGRSRKTFSCLLDHRPNAVVANGSEVGRCR